ncbi:MAG: D-alanine--D-alanine ligase, partial [Rhodothermales bacterium]|nr:D-alanine--D-alanine ligase [Rhodothermales bacterium]
VAVNIAEGARSRNREGEVPTLLELMDIPFTGSDAPTLSLSLDKVWTKDLARAAGVATPDYTVCRPGCNPKHIVAPCPFPLFVKPRYEGSAKGLTAHSRVENRTSLEREIRRVNEVYRQDAVVEVFVEGGGEFTVAIHGDPPVALPVIQRAVERGSRIGLHVLEREDLPDSAPAAGYEWDLPGTLTPELETRLQADALAVFKKLECRDFARVDFRIDADGHPWFLEINPLPTFRPDDTFAISAELAGRSYPEFLSEVLGGAVERAVARTAAGGRS